MNTGVLLLLSTFILPIFSMGCSFFKLSRYGKKWYFRDIIFLIMIALFHLSLGCLFYFELDSWLKNFVAGSVVLNSCFFVALEIFSCQTLKSCVRKILLSVCYLVNGWFVLFGLAIHNFPTAFLVATLLIYPFVSVFQILLYVVERNQKAKIQHKRTSNA